MSCNCENITCLKVSISPCDTDIDLGLVAPTTGDYLVSLEFNGAQIQRTVTINNGGNIIIPNIVNGDYIHEVQITTPDNTLLNNTCYSLNVQMILSE